MSFTSAGSGPVADGLAREAGCDTGGAPAALSRNQLGVASIVFFVVAAAAPLAVLRPGDRSRLLQDVMS